MFNLVGIKSSDEGRTGIAVQETDTQQIHVVDNILHPNSTREMRLGEWPSGYEEVNLWTREHRIEIDAERRQEKTIGPLCAYVMEITSKKDSNAAQHKQRKKPVATGS